LDQDFGGAAALLDDNAFGGVVEDKEAFLTSSAVAGWAGTALGRRVNPAAPDWQGIKDGIARGYFKNQAASNVSDGDLFGMISADYRAQDKVANAARMAAARGESWLGKFREVETQEAGNMLPGRTVNYLGLARAAHDEMAAKITPYRGTISKVADMARNIDTAPEGMDWGAMASELVKVPKEDRPYVLEALSLQTPGESMEGDAERIKTAFVRGMERYLDTAVSSLETAGESTAGEFLRQSYGFDVEAQTPEQKAQRADFLDLRDDMRDIATGKLAPLKAVKVAGMNIAGAAEMLPMTIGSFVPYVGAAVTLGSFQRSTYNDIRRNNPEMSREAANAIATASAPFQAITEIASDRFLFGRLPNLKRAFTQPIFSATGAAGMFATRAAIGTATEVGEEFAQGVIPLAVQSLASELSKDIPNADWNGFLGEFAESVPELISTVLPLAIVGAGVGQLSDFRAGRQLARSPDMLIAAQYSPESAAKISELANAGKWSEAEDAMRLDWQKINAKGADVSQVKATAEQRIQAAQRLKALQDEQAKVEALQDTSSPDYTVNVTRTPTGWQVRTGDGTVIPADTAEGAQQIANGIRQVGSLKEAQVLTEIIDQYYESGMGKGAVIKMTGEEVTASSGGVTAVRRDESGAPIEGSQRSFGPQALETVRKEVEAAGAASGTKEIAAYINGGNEIFPMRVAEGAKGITRILSLFKSRKQGAPQIFTFLHEDIESKFKQGLADGVWSEEDVRTAFRALAPAFANIANPTRPDAEVAKMSEAQQNKYYAQLDEYNWMENVRKIAAGEVNETMLRETFSEMYVRDRFALDRRGRQGTGIRPGEISRALEAAVMGANTQEQASAFKRILAMFRAFSAYLKGVFGTVKAIVKARDEGKIGEEWDTFVNKVLGIDEVKQMEGQVPGEVKSMLGVDEEARAVIDAGNMVFSTSRALPADSSNVTQMPDGAQLVGPTTFSITAYHGTPHKVDRFRMAKIGTGEGAQAYGWGLYFAKARKVAEEYQKNLAGKNRINPLDSSTASGIAADYINFYVGNKEAARAAVERAVRLDEMSGSEAADVIQFIEQSTVSAGNLYTVELLPDEVDFLDWDKPLSEHPQKIQDELFVEFGSLYDETQTGGEWYQGLVKDDTDPKTLSADLARIGIPGIRYLDGMSRDGGTGTSNFVIFDENLVRILEENGQKVDAGNMAFSVSPVTPAQDAEYLAAVEGGDMAKAQSMVDAAAKAAGYNVGPVWHGGTSTNEFSTLRPEFIGGEMNSFLGSFFAEKRESAERFAVGDVARARGEKGVNRSFYLKAQNPVSFKHGSNPGSDSEKAIKEAGFQSVKWTAKQLERIQKQTHKTYGKDVDIKDRPDLAASSAMALGLLTKREAGLAFRAKLEQDGIDSVFIENDGNLGPVWIVPEPSQIKSADPITYDDAGNVIPLSQRFNPETPNINFSISPIRNLNELSDQVERNFAENPAGALEVKSKVIRQFAKLADKWSNERWTPQGNKIRPISEKRTVKSLDKEQAMRQAQREAELVDEGMMKLTPATMMAYSEGVATLQDDPLIAKMLNDNGRLMSKATAEAQGKKIADLYDDAGWIPPQWYAKGAGIMPDVMANNLGFDTASEMWAALDSAIKTHRSAKAEYAKAEKAVRDVEKKALEQATKEAQAWRDEADKMQNEDWSPRESLVRDLITLEAIVAMFPAEIRGKIGGFVTLARKANESARLKVLQRQLERGQVLLEKHLREQYNTAILDLLDKAAPVGKPGEVKKSRFIVTVQDQLDSISELVGMDNDDVSKLIAATEAAVIAANNAEEADAALTQLNLLELFGGILDIKNTSSQELEAAHSYLDSLMKQGREARKMLDEARRERVKEMVADAKRDAFKGQTGPETTQAAKNKAAKNSGKAMLKKFFNELSGYDGVLRDAFGPKSKTATMFSDRFTLNHNAFEDVQNERRKRFRDFARELYRTRLGAVINQKLIGLERIENNSRVTYLKNREVETHKFTEEQAARIVADPKSFGFTEKDATAISEEIQAIQNARGRRKVFTYEQIKNEGERVEIPLSQMDALYLSMALRQPGILEQQQRYGYDQKTVDQLESFLTDDSKLWRQWMQGEYDAEYQRANEVYMRMFNARMPMIMFYAPLLKNHQGQQAILDPLNTGIASNSANPGSIKSRKARTSSLRIESALSVFWLHFNQMEYWIANAEYLRDVQSVMLNPEVREAVVSAHGEDGMATISAWVQLQMSRGVGKAALASAGNKMFRNVKSAISMKALALSYTTTLKTLPSVFYSLGEIHLSKWPAALVSGMKHWDRLWKTNIIQRRLDIGGMPELRDLGSSALPMSWVNQGIRYGSFPTMYADGVFTTYSAAMAYGTSFDDAKKQGASDEVAHKYAEERTALIVSKTAQPESWSQKSLFENDVSGAGALMFQFISDPRQKAALTGQALNQWRKGTATTEEAMRKFLAYWIIPGVMFQLANAIGRSLFKGDDDEWEVVDFATAALVGQLQGFVLLGSAAEMIFSAAIAAAAEKITGEEVKRKPVWNSPKNPLDQAAQELVKSVEKITKEEGEEGMGKAWEIVKSAGMLLAPMTPAGAIPSTAERVMKDTTNLFYEADE
jgi:hypothetical protein